MLTNVTSATLPNIPKHYKPRHDFDGLVPSAKSSLSLTSAREDELVLALDQATRLIGSELASLETVRRVWKFNRDNITVFRRGGKPVGVCALLLLNKAGLASLILGDFNPSEPDLSFLTPDQEEPAAIYVWGVVSPGIASEGVKQMSMRFRTPLYRRADLYTRAATKGGERMILGTGYVAVPGSPLSLFRYVRAANRS